MRIPEFISGRMPATEEDREKIRKKTKQGSIQPAEDFDTPRKREALGQVMKEDNRNKYGGTDAFSAAEAEAARRGGYTGSAVDKSTASGNSSRQTGTPATHKDGNF